MILTDYDYALILVRVIEANPLIDIHTPDINGLVREVRELTGYQIRSQPHPDYYISIDYDQYGRRWENERKRFNPRRFAVYVQKKTDG
jgi:hypothetical protein